MSIKINTNSGINVESAEGLENVEFNRRAFIGKLGAVTLLSSFFNSSVNASMNGLFEPVSSILYTSGEQKFKLDIAKCKERSDIGLFSHLTFLSMAHGLELKDEFKLNNGTFNFRVNGSEIEIKSFANRFEYINVEQAKLQLLASVILASVQKIDGAESTNDSGFANMKVRDPKLVKNEFTKHASRLEECMVIAVKERATGGQNTGSTRQYKTAFLNQIKSASGGYFDEISSVIEACVAIEFGPNDLRKNPFLANIAQTFLDFALYHVGWSKMHTNFVGQDASSPQVTLDKDNDARLFALSAAYSSLFPTEKLPEVSLVYPNQIENQLPSFCVKYSKSKFIVIPLSYLVGLEKTAKIDDLKAVVGQGDNNTVLSKAISDNLVHAVIASHGFKDSSAREMSKFETSGVIAITDSKKLSEMGVVLKDTQKLKSGKAKPSLSLMGWYS